MEMQFIEATTLSDAWFQTLYRILDFGNVFKIDRGSYAGQKRLEFDWVTVQIKYPGRGDRLPQIPEQYGIPNPVDDDYIAEYVPYLMTDELKKGESYTYGSRMTKAPVHRHKVAFKNSDVWKDIVIQDEEVWENLVIEKGFTKYFFSQIELMIWTYKNKGHRNNQMVLQVAQPSDMILQDPPCLRHIDTRIQDGKLHFFPYFRSWDLWGGFPANLAGIQILKEYCAEAIGVEDGQMIASSKGLHVYDYAFDMAKCIAMKDDMQLEGE
jgi:thymidylate synthase